MFAGSLVYSTELLSFKQGFGFFNVELSSSKVAQRLVVGGVQCEKSCFIINNRFELIF